MATGSQVLLQVRGWSAADASYADAVSDTGAGALVGASNLIGPVTVGQSIDLGTFVQSFTLTPVPEPSFSALALLAVLGGARRFFRKAIKRKDVRNLCSSRRGNEAEQDVI